MSKRARQQHIANATLSLAHPPDAEVLPPQPRSTPSFSGIPPASVLEALFAQVICNAQAAIDVAHEETSKLTTPEAVKIACVIATCEANEILRNLKGLDMSRLKPKHRWLVRVWKCGTKRMTKAVQAYEAEPWDRTAADMGMVVVDFVQTSHHVLHDATKAKDRPQIVQAYEAR